MKIKWIGTEKWDAAIAFLTGGIVRPPLTDADVRQLRKFFVGPYESDAIPTDVAARALHSLGWRRGTWK